MTKARIQPFCRANINNLRYFDGERVFLITVMDRNNALNLYNNLFCLKWKIGKISFNQAIQELIDKFKIVDNYTTEENFNSHCKHEFIPKKIESHLTNFIAYDLETHNTDRAKPYIMIFYRLSKIAGRFERDPTQEVSKKSINNTLVFVGDNCVGNAVEFLLKIKGEERKVKYKIVEYNFQLQAHNESGFNTWIILNNLPCDKRIVDINNNGNGIMLKKKVNGYSEKKANSSIFNI